MCDLIDGRAASYRHASGTPPVGGWPSLNAAPAAHAEAETVHDPSRFVDVIGLYHLVGLSNFRHIDDVRVDKLSEDVSGSQSDFRLWPPRPQRTRP